MHTKIREIRRLEEELGAEKEAYLRRAGWVHTCAVPGSYWLWTKKITHNMGGGSVVAYDALVNTDTAVHLQEAMDAQFVENDEE